MKLASLLTTDQILLEMRSGEHWEAIIELVDHLVEIGRVPSESREEVLDAMREREDQVSTGIGSGVAIPHVLSDEIEEVQAVFGRSREGIDFESLDNAPVHYVVLFIVPRSKYSMHLQTLAAIAKTFASREMRRGLAGAQTRGEILKILAGKKDEEPAPKKKKASGSGGGRKKAPAKPRKHAETMTPINEQISARLAEALDKVIPDCGAEPAVGPSTDPRFGDYQSNIAMVLAKRERRNPRELAESLVGALDLDGLATADVAGPGFLNFRVDPAAFAAAGASMLADERLGVPQPGQGRRTVIDFSAPNVAKPMHVGHIRSTIIGDSLSRVARALGYDVVTDNHIGDWGTQFGMILHGWKTILDEEALAGDPVAELLRVYREVNALAKEDDGVMEKCRAELVALQAGDEKNLGIWRRCIELSKAGLEKIYGRLDVSFDHWLGESFYNDRLAPLVDEFLETGLARISDGAVCVFTDGKAKREEDPFMIHKAEGWTDHPLLIRKADGGFLYATTDLATIDFRISEWKTDEIWYVVGAPQQLHFRQVFAAARRWGREAEFRHVAFGSILGEDRKLMKTRSGQNVQLGDVLAEAAERAAKVIAEKNPSLDDEERAEVAEILGIGAVKFAELSQNRLTDYVFSWDRMLSLQGDTAPYLQNSYVRIRSIFRKLGDVGFDAASATLRPEAPAELALVRQLVRFGEVVPTVLDDFRPNLLANYLLELARAFHSFYEACPVLKADGPVRESRLALCELTARVLRRGLGLLGIRVPERM
jgi:arginyl-tRNA synthetase